MPKYWVNNYFANGSFPEVGQKQKTKKRKKRKKRGRGEKERLNNGNNNDQATHGARKHALRTQAAWANFVLIKRTQDFYVCCMDRQNYIISGPNP